MHTHLQTADSLSWQSHSDFHQRKFHCGLWIWEVDFKSEQQKQSTVKEPNLLQVSEGNTQFWSGAFKTHPPTLVRLPRKWPHIRGRSYWQKRYRLNLAMTLIKNDRIQYWHGMNTCFVEYLQGPSTGCTCLGCASSENFITHFEETKEYSVTRTWCFWILVEAKFFIYKNLPEIFSALQNIFSEISFAKYVFSVKDLREVSAEGEIAQTTCLVRVWISFLWEWVSLYQNSACKTFKWGTFE